MRNKFLVLALMLLPALAAAQQMAPATTGAPTVSTVLDQQLSRIEKDFLPMANEMPAAKFDFAPTNGEFKGVRTFAQQVTHVTTVNYRIAAAMLGEKPPAAFDGVANAKTKDEIVKLLGESFAYLHKAFGAVTDKNLTEPVAFGSGKSTRLGMAILLMADQRDHYGQMVVYFRMNGMIPPASRH
jgi:uncharacterized damage-inducible protein DinB